jgi:hypothetical protein
VNRSQLLSVVHGFPCCLVTLASISSAIPYVDTATQLPKGFDPQGLPAAL